MPKNIVVCCDGTGNEFGDSNSNVVKLYTCMKVDKEQVAYYHPGVGTMGNPNKTGVGKKMSLIYGMAFGAGFMDNLADAYRFLMAQYNDGDGPMDADRIYLFGFSRGAYTVRALAGAISMFGLLCPGNEGHLPYLLQMYSTESKAAYGRDNRHGRRLQETAESMAFRETFSRQVPIHFVGVWDTVSSVGWIYDPVKLLFDGQNPVMRKGRHAVSVDERRCFFQDNLWGQPLTPAETPVLAQCYADAADRQQDIVQAWFAGVHSDVGGSYSQSESAPAMDALRWMLDEAVADGLIQNDEKRTVIFGETDAALPGLSDLNKPALPGVCLHESLNWKWKPLEWFPHTYFDDKGDPQLQWSPWPHRREIPNDALIHPSLWKRLTTDANYQPPNLNQHDTVPYEASGTPLLHPEVRAKVQAEGFRVYRPGQVAKSNAVAQMSRAAAVLFGLGLTLLMRRKG
ncbi:T6SS phospholipase effector Tle1-like catalytic domain-containing protein [Granulicella tundricola]|uniref:T6SS Phospholipase effector Tle1-like catalytic domain-containing protein n=1 Tax=Granulicella tundricola (strain ATCC BAA-1859 / DSM 23138 / MP5ACTX9) TaxID=1198114 RepID=E8X5B1_GRATM|nr:DUF2235 domain-containing protein [Granulicella tundricola]ADW68375.1 Protein of unknown function DUF2235 [Granulicella tundricola MP5ACTX9]